MSFERIKNNKNFYNANQSSSNQNCSFNTNESTNIFDEYNLDESMYEEISAARDKFLWNDLNSYTYKTSNGTEIKLEEIKDTKVFENKETGELLIFNADDATVKSNNKDAKINIYDSNINEINTGSGNDEISIYNSIVEKISSGPGNDTIDIQNSQIIKEIQTGSGNDFINIKNSDLDLLNTSSEFLWGLFDYGEDTVMIDGVDAEKITTGRGDDKVIINESTIEELDLGAGKDAVLNNGSTTTKTISDEDDTLIENENYLKFNIEKLGSIKSDATIPLDDGSTITVQEYVNYVIKQPVGFETEEEYKQYSLETLKTNLEAAKELFLNQEANEGNISDAYNFLKELSGLGITDKDIELALSKQEEIIKGLEAALNGESNMTFEEAYQYYLGTEFSTEKIDNYTKLSNAYNAIITASYYDEDYLKKFEAETNSNFDDFANALGLSQLETYGKDTFLNELAQCYKEDQESFTEKLSSIISTAGIIMTVAGYAIMIYPPAAGVGLSIAKAGNIVLRTGMFIDNALDATDTATSSNGKDLLNALSSEGIKAFDNMEASEREALNKLSNNLLETGVELATYKSGKLIGKFTNSLNTSVQQQISNKFLAKIMGQTAETVVDTTLSLGADYTITQGQSLIATGKFIDNSEYWNLERFLSEGQNQLIGIFGGLSAGKLESYQQKIIFDAQTKIAEGDIEGARTYLESKGIKFDDASFSKFVDDINTQAQQLISQEEAETIKSADAKNDKITDDLQFEESERIETDASGAATKTKTETNPENNTKYDFEKLTDETGKILFDEKTQAILSKQNNKVVELAIKLAQLRDAEEKGVFSSSDIVKLCDYGESAFKKALKLSKLKNKQGGILLTGNVITKLTQADKKTTNNIIELARTLQSNQISVLFSGNTLINLISESKETQQIALELAKEKYDDGSALITNPYLIYKLAKIPEAQREDAIKILKLHLTTTANISSYIECGENTCKNILKLAELKDTNGNLILDGNHILFFTQDVELSDDYFNNLIKLFELKDDNQNLILNFDTMKELATLPPKKLEGIEKIITLKDENGTPIFSNDEIKFLLTNTELNDKNIAAAKTLSEYKDSQGYHLFTPYYATILINGSEESFQSALKLANLKTQNGSRLFQGSIIVNLVKNLETAQIDKAIEAKKAGIADSYLVEIAKLSDTQFQGTLSLINSGINKNAVIHAAILSNNSSAYSLTQKVNAVKILENLTPEEIETINKTLDINVETLKNKINHLATPTKVSDESYKKAFQGFFANNNTDIQNALKTFDFTAYGRQGLPLEYSREDFLKDLSETTKSLSEQEQTTLFNKLGIEVIKDKNGNITGYNGIINISQLQNIQNQSPITQIVYKFILQNKINTGDAQIDKALNSLIEGFPEFINIIGKQQHLGHQYSVDVHILNVLSECIKNPNYDALSDMDKTCLKLVAMFHDIGKFEGIKDIAHQDISARYTKDILDKSAALPQTLKDRIYELIKNHHWLQEYNQQEKNAEKISAIFRRDGDYKIAQIMSQSDILSIEKGGRKSFLDSLSESSLLSITSEIQKTQEKGQMVFTTRIIKDQSETEKGSAIWQEYNGRMYRVVDFTKIPDNEDLYETYGFAPGTKKGDVRLLVHMINENSTAMINGMNTLLYLQDVSQEGYLCTSYISPYAKETFYNRHFGIAVEAENYNISDAINYNQSSGGKKRLANFTYAYTNSKNDSRNFIPQTIKETLELSDAEYAELYKQLSKYSQYNQIDDNAIYTFGDKKIKGSEVKTAIKKANDNLLIDSSGPYGNNEINVYNPKINAFVAKVNSIEEIPQELLDWANRNNLVIYILGE